MADEKTEHLREELAQLDEDIKRLKEDEKILEDPEGWAKGHRYYESGDEKPQEDDQTITPPG